MAISWSGLPVRPEDLVEEVYTPSHKGSLQVAMIATTRRHDRLVYENLENGLILLSIC